MKRLFLLTLTILLSLTGFSQVANYGYTSTTSTWAANSSPTVITGLGSGINDALSAAINIGFTFTYDGVSCTQFKASSNGFITFNTSNTLAQPTNNLKTSTERSIVAPLWDDDQTGASGNVNYKLTGTSPNQILTIEWLALRWNKSGFSAGTIDCQVKLYETTNVIEFIYNRGTYQSFGNSTGIGASIGLSGSVSGDFISLSDISSSPTKSTTTETTTIGASPTNLTTMTQSGANTQIPNGTKYRFYPPVANDNCSGSTSVTVNTGTTCTSTTAGTTVGATQSLSACVGTADDDVWYTFVATQPIHTITETPGTIGDAVIQAYSGSCASLSTIACVNNVTSGNEVTTLTNLTIGNTYYVRVHSFANGTGQGTFTMCVTTPPTITTTGTLASFTSCSGVVSSEQTYTVSGSGLTSNITITPPTGFEVSTSSGSGFTSLLTLTQSSGVVSSTTVYVRLTSSSSGTPSGNITNASTNATTQNISVSGTITPTSVGGTVASNQTISSGSSPATISLTGNTGSVLNWEKSSDQNFTTPTNIVNTTTSLSSATMGTLTQTTYYRAVVKNGSCPSVNSSYVKITITTTLPIELLYFKGKNTKNGNLLEWETASEYNNDYYTLYRSDYPIDWLDIIKIDGNGTSSITHHYFYLDKDFTTGINYYYLKQTDFDGKIKQYEIISIDNRLITIELINITNILGNEVDIDTPGLKIFHYSDGTIIKRY